MAVKGQGGKGQDEVNWLYSNSIFFISLQIKAELYIET